MDGTNRSPGRSGWALARWSGANAQFTQIPGCSLSAGRYLSSGGCYSFLSRRLRRVCGSEIHPSRQGGAKPERDSRKLWPDVPLSPLTGRTRLPLSSKLAYLAGLNLHLYTIILTNDAPRNSTTCLMARDGFLAAALHRALPAYLLGKPPSSTAPMITVLVKRQQPFICRNPYRSPCRSVCRSLVASLYRRRRFNAQTFGVGGVV